MNTSLIEKMKIYARGKYPHAFNGGEFERLALDSGFKASNASRRAREMVNDGILERIGGKSVSYRYIYQKNELPSARTEQPKGMSPLFQ